MIDATWLADNAQNPNLRQSVFFQVQGEGACVLFLPQIKAVPLVRRAAVVTHTDVLYDLEQLVIQEKTIGYIVYPKCPTIRVHDNGIFLHQRKTIDVTPSTQVVVHNTLPHFSIVNNKQNTTTIFCRDVTTSPKT